MRTQRRRALTWAALAWGAWAPLSLFAQAPTSAPSNPLQDGGGAERPPLIVISEARRREPTPPGEEIQALSLRGIDKEFATLSLTSSLQLRVADVLPLQLRAGAQLRLREQLVDTGQSAAGLTGDYLAATLQGELSLSKRLRLASGLRIESAQLPEGPLEEMSLLSPEVLMLYQLGARLRLHLSIGQSQQQLSASPRVARSANFSARAHNTNIGGEYTGSYLFLRVNTFHHQLSGVAEAVDTGDGRGLQLLNAGEGFTSGLETIERLSLGFFGGGFKDVSLWSKQTLLISRVDDGSGSDRNIQGLPLFVGSAGLRYFNEERGTSASVTATYAGQRRAVFTDEAPELLLDLSLRQRLYDESYWYISLENLTDEAQALSDLSLTSGIPAQELTTTGRTIFTGVVLTPRR